MNDIVIKLLFTLLGLFIVLNWGLLMGATMQKIVAKVAHRVGIPFYQPWIDLTKMYTKRSSITHGVMFYLGPVFRLGGGLGIFLFLPLIFGSEHFSNFSWTGDLVLILYFQFLEC